MVPEIWSTTDRMFCHSGPFFAILPSFALLPFFFFPFALLPFLPFTFFALFYPMYPENQNFEKMKKTPEDVIISQMCTIMYGS